jgi:hypothetical protein
MYDPINKTSGIAAVSAFFGNLAVTTGPDGLQMAPKGPSPVGHAVFPQFLSDWLLDLRLLRRIPLCYLVPDARLLPQESIRFFHVDYTWLDRVIDGAYSAANLGTVDATFTYGSLKSVRDALDDDLEALAKSTSAIPWRPGKNPMTGCLIRSELVRRWPKMIVMAFEDVSVVKKDDAIRPLAILRAETISTDIFIALFAGQPDRVQIREPYSGSRFGVEETIKGVADTIAVDERDGDGVKVLDGKIILAPVNAGPQAKNSVTITVNWKDKATRTLDIADLNTQIAKIPELTKIPAWSGSRMVALQLEQPAYVQDFVSGVSGVDESQGSLSPQVMLQANHGSSVFNLSGGKTMSLDKFIAPFAEAQKRRKK